MVESEFLKKDPAIERFSAMRENAHLYFRMTSRKLPYVLFHGLVMPVAVYWIAVRSMVRDRLYVLYEQKPDRNRNRNRSRK